MRTPCAVGVWDSIKGIDGDNIGVLTPTSSQFEILGSLGWSNVTTYWRYMGTSLVVAHHLMQGLYRAFGS